MNVFLDCGTHFGQGLSQIIDAYRMNSSWHIETYEANPVTYNEHKNNRKFDFVQYKNLAVYDRDGKINFNIETPPNEGDTGMGSSLIDLSLWNPWGGTLRPNFKITKEIDCFDFSSYLKNNFSSDDFIVCKMDIEGAEYAVLEKILQDKNEKYIKKLYVEFHSRFFTNSDEMLVKEQHIRNAFENIGILIENWG